MNSHFLLPLNGIARFSFLNNFPVSASGQGSQLPSISVQETIGIEAGEATDVKCHSFMQYHCPHTRLNGPHQGLGLLTAQTLTPDIQMFALYIVQNGDQVTTTDIFDM